MRIDEHYRIVRGQVPLDSITTRPQMRIAIDPETIKELRENIDEHGLLYPLLVATTDAGLVIFAGHRRLLACRTLRAEGRFGPEVDVLIFHDISPITIAFLQASENIHEAVPPAEAARFYEITWQLLKEADPDFPLSQFARAVGRSEETIRSALRFSLLPDTIQKLVRDGIIVYGIAIQIARLERHLDDDALIHWAVKAAAARIRVPEIRKSVSAFLREKEQGQGSLLDMMTEEAKRTNRRDDRRHLLDRGATRAFWDNIQYLSRVLGMIDADHIGSDESPFHMHSPLEALRRNIILLKRLLPHLRELMDETEYKDTERVIASANAAVEVLTTSSR